MPMPTMKTLTWGQSRYKRVSTIALALPPLYQQEIEEKTNEDYWGPRRKEALAAYRTNRENGTPADNPSRAFPYDGKDTLEKGRGSNKPDWYYLTYTEGPNDKKWMADKDQNYLARLKHEEQNAAKKQSPPPIPPTLERNQTSAEVRRLTQEMETLKRAQESERQQQQKEKAAAERQRQAADKQKDAKIAQLLAEKNAAEKARITAEEKLSSSSSSSTSSSSSASSTSTSAYDQSEVTHPTRPISDPSKLTLSFAIDPDELQRHEKLGEGSYSMVYRATYRFQDVAVKELKSSNLSEKALFELKNEVNIMARLNSKHIVQFHGACFETPYRLVMEYMPKGSLYGVLQSHAPLGWQQRYRIGLDVTIGLYQMHEQKPPILHRDLKSLNVLLDKDYRAKLTDFGLSKIRTETASTTHHTGGSVGSLPWMAPELFGLRPKYSAASDIYALGMVLWELASRQLPYNKVADSSEIRFAVKEGEREEFPDDCPMAYGKLIERCWAQKPDKRPSAKLVAESLMKLFKASNAGPLASEEATKFKDSEFPDKFNALSMS